MALALDTINVHSLEDLARRGYPWQEWDLLRKQAPVFWYDRPEVEPFWAISKHADILEISRRSDVFINGGPRLRRWLKDEGEGLRQLDPFGLGRGWDPDEAPDLVFMDDPRHKQFRSLVSRAFTPVQFRRSEAHFRELSIEFATDFERLLADGPQDFVKDMAVKLPLAAICEMFDLPREDWRRVLIWTNAMLGDVDPSFARDGEDIMLTALRALNEFRAYLQGMIDGNDDNGSLLDLIVRGEVDGKPLTEQQIHGFLFLLIFAGNETTRNATSGGLLALLQHPEQLQRLCADPTLLDSAIEEMLRWTSPVYSFFRTVTREYELRGVKLAVGDTVGMFYASANRDEDVFTDPYTFDISRTPNEHLAFGGYGAHFCLGANLARAEMRATFTALLPLLPRLEQAGEPCRNPNLHVPGYRSIPVRLRA